MKALTDQPYADWRDHELPPTVVPSPATLSGLTLTGMAISPALRPNYHEPTPRSVPYATSRRTTVRPELGQLGRYVHHLPGREPN